MIKRSLLVESRSYLSYKDGSLHLDNRISGEKFRIPIEDIGYLELGTSQITITSAALAKLADQVVTVMYCDDTYQPVGLCLPLVGNTLHAERLRIQIDCSVPNRKRIWQSIVRCKLQNQEQVGRSLGYTDLNLKRYINSVYSGDRTNREAAGAKLYWKAVLTPFGVGRDPRTGYPNNILNYGYSVLRALTARCLVRCGLHPAIGIHHSNKYNHFALADDVMEMYRPFVDYHILMLVQDEVQTDQLTSAQKMKVLEVMVADVHHEKGRRPLSNSVELICAQLVQALGGDVGALDLPQFRA